nr:hypothetical protein [bacterium]
MLGIAAMLLMAGRVAASDMPPGLQGAASELMDKLPVEQLGEGGRQTVEGILQGDMPAWTKQPLQYLFDLVGMHARDILLGMAGVLSVALVGGVMLHLLPGDKNKPLLTFAILAALGVSAGVWLLPTAGQARAALRQIDATVSGGLPLMSVLLAAGGRIRTAATVQTVSALLSGGLIRTCTQAMMGVSVACAGLAVAYGVSGEALVEDICGAVQTCLRMALGALCALFGGAMAICLLPAQAADSLALSAARYAASSVTVVGALASQALSSALGSSHLLRSAIGSGGIIFVLSAALAPAVGLGLTSLLMRLCGGLAEIMLGGRAGGMLRLLGRTAGTMALLVIAPAAMAVLSLVVLSGWGG